MTDNDNEQYVQTCIQEMNTWKTMHSDELISLRASINQFLSVNTDNSIYTLCSFLTNNIIMTTFISISDIAYCILAADITVHEYNTHSQLPKFMYNTLNIDGLIHKLQCYRFLILNIEYNVERPEAIQHIIKDMNNQLISPAALVRLIHNTAVNKTLVINLIINELKNLHMYDAADVTHSLYNNLEN